MNEPPKKPIKIPFTVYEGDELLKISPNKAKPIVEDFLFEDDYVLISAKEKSGKSVFGLQLACSLSTGNPFLGMLDVKCPMRVWYFSTEGKDDDTKDRLIRMTKRLDLNKDNLKLICSAGLRFNTQIGQESITDLLIKYKDELPHVIIIDSLYSAISGSIKDDDVVNDFTAGMRSMARVCGAAVVIMHHSKKTQLDATGKVIDRGDEEMYGSAFLRASVDHIFHMGTHGKWVFGKPKKGFIKCDTQRSGSIIDKIELLMHEPSPLWFEVVEEDKGSKDRVEEILRTGKHTTDEIIKETGLSKQTIYSAYAKIKGVMKEGTKPKYYSIGKGK